MRLFDTDTASAYAQLMVVENMFQNKVLDMPVVYTLTNKHTIARGIITVLFTGLTSSESSADNTINLSLNFEEFKSAEYIQKN